MNILLLNAHPDEGSLCDSIAAAYAAGAKEAGHEIRQIALRELQFDLVLRGGYHSRKPLEPDVARQHELIYWCRHLVVVTPNWWWSAPALFKGYIDRVFIPGFSMRYHARFPYVEPLLKGRSARVIYTQNSPWLAGWLFRGDLFWRWIAGAVLGHCGFRPVRRTALYRAKDTTPEKRKKFLETVAELGAKGG
jgi:putative NADPH-quinone reductase